MKSTAAIIIVLVLLKLYLLGRAPDAPTRPTSTAGQWAVDLAAALGNPAPSADLLALLVAWQRAEGSAAAYNPLATTQPWQGATCFNTSPCVKNYLSYEDGIAATVATLQSGHTGYAEIIEGIRSNNPDLVLYGIAASPWGTSATLTARVYQEERAAPAGLVQSAPIVITNDACGWNVASALLASDAALVDVVIQPGAVWSFNAAMGDPEQAGYATCAGVPGGSWCNLAARYAQVARALGARLTFLRHGVDLGAGPENDVLIWNIGGLPGFEGGRQDLLIENTTARPMRLWAALDGEQVLIVGRME